MEIVDFRAISVWAVNPRDARIELLYASWKYEYLVMNPFLYDKKCLDTPRIQQRGQLVVEWLS